MKKTATEAQIAGWTRALVTLAQTSLPHDHPHCSVGPGRWFRVALSFGAPAMLAVKARNVPRPLIAGLAGVVALLVYGTLAARVDGRFARLACAFTVPMALIPRRK